MFLCIIMFLFVLLVFVLLVVLQFYVQDVRLLLNVGYYEFFFYIYIVWDGYVVGFGVCLVCLLLEWVGYCLVFCVLFSVCLYLGLQDGSVVLWVGVVKLELVVDIFQVWCVFGYVSLNLYYLVYQLVLWVFQDLVGCWLILISGYSYWKLVIDFIQDFNLYLCLYCIGIYYVVLCMFEFGCGDYLFDYQVLVEVVSCQVLVSQELYCLLLWMIVLCYIFGVEVLCDCLDQVYDQLWSDGVDLFLL